MKSYLIDGREFYIYWDVCRAIDMPENKRQGFWKTYDIGVFGADIIHVKDVEKNKEILGADYYRTVNGLYYVTPAIALELRGAWKVHKKIKGIN